MKKFTKQKIKTLFQCASVLLVSLYDDPVYRDPTCSSLIYFRKPAFTVCTITLF